MSALFYERSRTQPKKFMLKNFLCSAAGGDGNGNKADQGDILAELSGMKAQLAPLKLALPDLISQHASLTAGKATLDGEIAKLKGDSAKLVAGAALPTDLVSAANTIDALTKERDTLKANSTSVEAAVAKEVAKLGLLSGKPAPTGAPKGKLTMTEQVLAARGVKTLEELNAKMETAAAQKNPATAD